MSLEGGGRWRLFANPCILGSLSDAPLDFLRLPLVDWRWRTPRTSSIVAERSKSGGVSTPETECATVFGAACPIMSLALSAVSAAGGREFRVFNAVLSEGGGRRCRRGGGIADSGGLALSMPEARPCVSVLAGRSDFWAGNSLCSSLALLKASRLAAAVASETLTV